MHNSFHRRALSERLKSIHGQALAERHKKKGHNPEGH